MGSKGGVFPTLWDVTLSTAPHAELRPWLYCSNIFALVLLK